ncbi:MAG: hypothetical protein R2729_06405 [Bryobacteraceae bacterium]
MALFERHELEDDLVIEEPMPRVARGVIYGAGLGALAGGAAVALGHIPVELDLLSYTVAGRGLLILAGLGGGGLIGAIMGLLQATARELAESRRADRLA